MTIQEDGLGDVEVLGEVMNGTEFTLAFVKVNFTFRDTRNAVIGLEYTYIRGVTVELRFVSTDTGLRPGETAPFRLFTNVPWGSYALLSQTVTYDRVEDKIPGDIDEDGDVDFDDFFILADNFGRSVAGAAGKPLASAVSTQSQNQKAADVTITRMQQREIGLE